jgi:probable HAF family extracellular repeat protein
MLSIVAFLVIAPIAAGSSANAATFSFTQIDAPGATDTSARGINDAGQIVGTFSDSTGFHGFLNAGGSFTQIDVPDATNTQAFGINDAGQIVGLFIDSTGEHGFLATPTAAPVPEPSTITLLSVGMGLTVLCVIRRRVISSQPL